MTFSGTNYGNFSGSMRGNPFSDGFSSSSAFPTEVSSGFPSFGSYTDFAGSMKGNPFSSEGYEWPKDSLSGKIGGVLEGALGSGSASDPDKDKKGEGGYLDDAKLQGKINEAIKKATQFKTRGTHQVAPNMTIYEPPDNRTYTQPMVMGGGSADGGGGPSLIQKAGGVATGLASAGVLGPWGMVAGLGAQFFG